MLKQLWNKFCKSFSHNEYRVQLVFAPHFRQKHIPQYNYVKQQQQKNPRGINKGNDPWMQLTCWIKELQNPFASDRWQTFWHSVKCPTGRASFWVKFPTVRSLTRVKCPRIARGWGGGMGGFGSDWYIIDTGRDGHYLYFNFKHGVRRVNT